MAAEVCMCNWANISVRTFLKKTERFKTERVEALHQMAKNKEWTN